MDFSIQGYRDADGERHYLESAISSSGFQQELGSSADLDDVTGLFVHVTDPDDDNFHEFYWVYNLLEPFESWDEWYAYVVGMMEMYGMSL